MIFELRSYDLKPGKVSAYLEYFRTFGLELVTRHLPMGGYWMVETGRLNRIEHLWIYEDFAERDAARAGLVKESAWMEDFIPRAFADVVAQENRFMRLARSSAAFDLVVAARKTPHRNQSSDTLMFAGAMQGLTFSETSGDRGGYLAQFRIVSGTAPGTFVTLSAGAVDEILAGTGSATSHELLRPLTFSPLR